MTWEIDEEYMAETSSGPKILYLTFNSIGMSMEI